MIAEAAALEPTQYAVQYELLRSQVIGARSDQTAASSAGQRCGVGLALLLREGLPSWLTAIDAVIRASLASAATATDAAKPPVAASLTGDREVPSWLCGVQRHDITTLLASLVLSTRDLQRSSQTEGCHPCH